jgi:hypothetical protein
MPHFHLHGFITVIIRDDPNSVTLLLKKTPWLVVRELTVPTERPPLVDEIYCQLLWVEGCRVVSAADPPTSVNLSFLDRSRYFSFK